MAFTVEDGSGNPDANAYVDTTFVDEYQADRGRTDWGPAAAADKEAAIIRATDYIDQRFGRRFRGERQTKAQALEWPRLDAFDDDGFLLSGDGDDIPRQLQKACAEYALITFRMGELAPDPLKPVPAQELDGTPQGNQVITGEVRSLEQVVGPLKEKTEYASNSVIQARNLSAAAKGVQSSLVSDFVIPEYPKADLWLEELIRPQQAIELFRG